VISTGFQSFRRSVLPRDAARVDGIGITFAGAVQFFLVTSLAGGRKSGLGTNSAGVPRANANPCP